MKNSDKKFLHHSIRFLSFPFGQIQKEFLLTHCRQEIYPGSDLFFLIESLRSISANLKYGNPGNPIICQLQFPGISCGFSAIKIKGYRCFGADPCQPGKNFLRGSESGQCRNHRRKRMSHSFCQSIAASVRSLGRRSFPSGSKNHLICMIHFFSFFFL